MTDKKDEVEVQRFKAAGLGHILEDSNQKTQEICLLEAMQQPKLALPDFFLKAEKETLKAFDFMPEAVDFKAFGLPQAESFIARFCSLFNLDLADFTAVSDAQFQASMESLLKALSKKGDVLG